MALLARFACGCTQRVEIPAPPVVRCDVHGARAQLITLPSGQVRYRAEPSPPASAGSQSEPPPAQAR